MQSKETRLGPHHFSAPELKKVGVRIHKMDQTVILVCEVCHCIWFPDLQTGGKLPRGYWKCPEGRCNVEQA